jgi:RNA polymerase sigma-70 factor (ECF subfamily)
VTVVARDVGVELAARWARVEVTIELVELRTLELAPDVCEPRILGRTRRACLCKHSTRVPTDGAATETRGASRRLPRWPPATVLSGAIIARGTFPQVQTGVRSEIARWLNEGLGRWPDLAIEADVFAAHLARLGVDASAEHPHTADIYLACGCALGLPAAIAVFERELMPVVRAAARKIDPASEFIDEVAQATRERLLVARHGEDPRIAEYGGRGTLAAWVRIAAMRIAMNLLRPRRKHVLVDDDAFFEALPRASEDDRRRVGARYAAACSEALRDAFATLTARERNLLRMHHLHGLTVDEMAPTFRVHRATVARWLAHARERLLEGTRAGVTARLQIGNAEAESILRVLLSRLDVSVSRLLAE